MSTEVINSDNLGKYFDLLDKEESDNIGRLYFRTLGILDDKGDPKGAAIWQLKYLEDEDKETRSFLRSAFFSKDIEKQFFASYGKMCLAEKAVSTSFELPLDIHSENEEIFKKHGFSVARKEASDICVTVGQLKSLSLMKKKKVPEYVTDLTEVDEKTFKRGILNCIFHGLREMTEDLNKLPVDWFEKTVSSCSESDGRIEGFLLVRRLSTGRLKIELLIDVGAEPDMELLNMIRFSITRAAENYPDETEVIIPRSDAMVKKLTGYLFPGQTGKEILSGKRREGK